MLDKSSSSWGFRLIVGSDYRWRLLRHTLLWVTTLGFIFRGFYFLATRITHPSSDIIQRYVLASTLLFGSLTVGSYWALTTLTRHFILRQFRIGLFLGGILVVHLITAEVVLGHFWLFIKYLTLPQLPGFYTVYAQHVADLSIWEAPIDSIIVWFFSFSLVYNYLLYAVSLKVFKDLFTINLRQVSLEKENLRLEFDFLKAQMNPHFLFNTLNNIYSFSVRSPEKVSDTILKLADLLRYSLYETSEEQVPLPKEIAFLTSYIDMQRIRHDNHVTIRFTVSGQPAGQLIPPLLLIVFVENAFKHGIEASSKASWVDIQMVIMADCIHFQVTNSIPCHTESNTGGIGLANVRKRLQYLYPQGHQLHISAESAQFNVTLTLTRHESTLSGHRSGR